ncbi:hypothetical protein GCM10027047_12330 [Rhodococcus aerolatus]
MFVGPGLTVTNDGGGRPAPIGSGTGIGYASPQLAPGASVTFTVTVKATANPPALGFVAAGAVSPTPDTNPFDNVTFRFPAIF